MIGILPGDRIRTLPLLNHSNIIVMDEDDFIRQHTYRSSRPTKNGFTCFVDSLIWELTSGNIVAAWIDPKGGPRRKIELWRLVLDAEPSDGFRFKDGNRFDFRRKNLILVKGQHSLCDLCGCFRERKSVESELKEAGGDLSVVALVDGAEVILQACSRECREQAWTRYERTKEWLVQEQRRLSLALSQLKTVKHLIQMRNRGASVSRSTALRLANSSPA